MLILTYEFLTFFIFSAISIQCGEAYGSLLGEIFLNG